MRKTAFLLLTAFMLVPAAMFGDSYSKLWKQVDEAANKDLPKTQIQLLQTIADKAEAGGDYGHLLKAETCMASVWYSISPDSLPSRLARLEDKAEACSKSDGALSAVYYAALGKIYSSYRNFSPYAAVGIDNSAKAAEFFRKSLADPALLASKKALCYEPFVVKGRDGKYFNDDLLSLIGYTAEDYATMHSYYATTQNRTATLLTALAMVRQNNQRNGGIYFRELKKSRYAVSLDSLINIYSDLNACGEVAVERYNFMQNCNDVNADDLVAYINNAVNRWGEWPRMNVLRNELKRLTNPQFVISLTNNVVLPYKSNVIKMNLRNVSEIKVKVARLAVDGDTELNPSQDDGYKELRKKIVPQNVHVIEKGVPFTLGEFKVTPFGVPHDSTDNVGYFVEQGGVCFCLLTDVGHITEEMHKFIGRANYLVIEANHSVEMLLQGNYPQYLKDRILGSNGHLSNDACGKALAEYATSNLRHVWLCHLSEENNHPELARKTVEHVLRSYGIVAGKDFGLEVLKRKTPSEIYKLL